MPVLLNNHRDSQISTFFAISSEEDTLSTIASFEEQMAFYEPANQQPHVENILVIYSSKFEISEDIKILYPMNENKETTRSKTFEQRS